MRESSTSTYVTNGEYNRTGRRRVFFLRQSKHESKIDVSNAKMADYFGYFQCTLTILGIFFSQLNVYSPFF
jgi:hypothetical protein